MDVNNSAQAPITPNVAPQPATPQAQMPGTTSTGSNEQSSSSNKIILWFVVGLVIIVLVVGGIYFFLSRQQGTQTQTQAPITQVSPSPVTAQNLESDLNNINVDTAGATSDFTAVDQDLKSL